MTVTIEFPPLIFHNGFHPPMFPLPYILDHLSPAYPVPDTAHHQQVQDFPCSHQQVLTCVAACRQPQISHCQHRQHQVPRHHQVLTCVVARRQPHTKAAKAADAAAMPPPAPVQRQPNAAAIAAPPAEPAEDAAPSGSEAMAKAKEQAAISAAQTGLTMSN